MKITIVTCLPAEWYMYVYSCHLVNSLSIDFRSPAAKAFGDGTQVNLLAEGDMYVNAGQVYAV